MDESSLRREHRRLSVGAASSGLGVADVPNLVAWLEDAWSEIRKDAAKALRTLRSQLTPEANALLLGTLIAHIDAAESTWQVVHGSLLGVTELLSEETEAAASGAIQSLCLQLVGHKLPPVREAAAACMLRLIAARQLTLAQVRYARTRPPLTLRRAHLTSPPGHLPHPSLTPPSSLTQIGRSVV